MRQGDTLVHIHSSLAEAKLMQAEGMKQVATSQNQKVDAGTRKQIVQAAYDRSTLMTGAPMLTSSPT